MISGFCAAITNHTGKRHGLNDEHQLCSSLLATDSRTARSITGSITLSGNPNFANVGSEVFISFGNQKRVKLTSQGAFWRQWSYGETNETAEVFQFETDPKELENGNTLCGAESDDNTNLFAVFIDSYRFGATLKLHIYQGVNAPYDGDSEGLCGTFSYSAE